MANRVFTAVRALCNWAIGSGIPEKSPGKPFMAFSNAKRQLDQVCGVKDWVLHDLRRTVVGGMAVLGVAPHVADKILNHQSGTISGVAAVYQRHEFLTERKAAIELWAIHISGLLQPKSAAAAR